MSRFHLYLISYLQNELGLLSIQQKEPNTQHQETMYKTTVNKANIGQTKHSQTGHSHSVTGIFISVRRNKEYCFITLSNCVCLIKYILQWISAEANDFSRLQQKYSVTHLLIYSNLCCIAHSNNTS